MKFVKASSQSAVPCSSPNRVVRNNVPAQQGFRSYAWVGFYKGFSLFLVMLLEVQIHFYPFN